MDKTPQLNEAKHQQILDAARQVFMEDGLSGASMQRITDLSKVSKATVYNHFPSKEALFEAVMHERVEQLRQQVFSLESTQAPPEAVLFGLGCGFVAGILSPSNMKMARQLVAEGWRMPHLGRAFYLEGPDRGRELLAGYLQALCDNGRLSIPDTRLAAEQFIALAEVGMSARTHMTGEVPSEQEIAVKVRSAVDLFLRGYAA
jgi:TetR/AcrR family transcriptional repressor of mexJK operon